MTGLVFAMRLTVLVWICGLIIPAMVLAEGESIMPFPVLDQTSPTEGSQFPYLKPPSEQVGDWPPLFHKPPKVALERQNDMEQGNSSAMDFLPAPPTISVVIDDVGYNRRGMEESLALPTAVVLAILPKTPYAVKAAEAAYKQQRTTILHAPMENSRELKLGPGGLYASMDEVTFKRVLNEDIDSVPWVQGVNNHMGSLLTTHRPAMEWVMDVMAERSLFFIDSITSPNSVAHSVAIERKIQTVSRDVFLDNVKSQAAIHHQFERLVRSAHKNGSAIAIGHPYPETMHYLMHRLAQPLSVTLVPIGQQLR